MGPKTFQCVYINDQHPDQVYTLIVRLSSKGLDIVESAWQPNDFLKTLNKKKPVFVVLDLPCYVEVNQRGDNSNEQGLFQKVTFNQRQLLVKVNQNLAQNALSRLALDRHFDHYTVFLGPVTLPGLCFLAKAFPEVNEFYFEDFSGQFFGLDLTRKGEGNPVERLEIGSNVLDRPGLCCLGAVLAAKNNLTFDSSVPADSKISLKSGGDGNRPDQVMILALASLLVLFGLFYFYRLHLQEKTAQLEQAITKESLGVRQWEEQTNRAQEVQAFMNLYHGWPSVIIDQLIFLMPSDLSLELIDLQGEPEQRIYRVTLVGSFQNQRDLKDWIEQINQSQNLLVERFQTKAKRRNSKTFLIEVIQK